MKFLIISRICAVKPILNSLRKVLIQYKAKLVNQFYDSFDGSGILPFETQQILNLSYMYLTKGEILPPLKQTISLWYLFVSSKTCYKNASKMFIQMLNCFLFWGWQHLIVSGNKSKIRRSTNLILDTALNKRHKTHQISTTINK